MKNIIFSKFIVFLWSMFLATGITTNAFAGSVDIPHTFSPGDTARANEVNSNFSALETAVNDNDSRITTNEAYLADLDDRSWEKSGNNLYYNNGNVGIGTMGPNANMHIKNPTDFASLEIESNNGRAVLRLNGSETTDGEYVGGINFFSDSNHAARITNIRDGSVEKGKLIFGTTPAGSFLPVTRMTIGSDGNVGIGTTIPEEELHIAGYSDPVTEERPKILLENLNTNSDNGAAIKFRGRNACYTIGIDHMWDGSNNFYLWDYNTEEYRILVDSSGNVGIGTTNPQGTLDVNGAIYQRGSSLHADYVFEPDYKLESIEEHSEFMRKEKHLKAVPKAKEDENGNEIIEYGSHIKGILEELEKAHLYIAQLNDAINEQQRIILKLSTKIDILSKQAN